MAGETVITVVGNLTADPELRFTPSGAAVASFTVASTPRTFDRASNEWKDGEALFLRCSIWRQAAENVAESLHARHAGHRVRAGSSSAASRPARARSAPSSSSTSTRSARRCATPRPRSTAPSAARPAAASAAGGGRLRRRRSATTRGARPAARRRSGGGRRPVRAARRRRAASPTSPPSRAISPSSIAGDTTHAQATDSQAEEEGEPARPRPRSSYIDYKDTDLLRKFISDRGKIRARRVTGVSAQQQRQIAKAVKNAREMALLPYTSHGALIGARMKLILTREVAGLGLRRRHRRGRRRLRPQLPRPARRGDRVDQGRREADRPDQAGPRRPRDPRPRPRPRDQGRAREADRHARRPRRRGRPAVRLGHPGRHRRARQGRRRPAAGQQAHPAARPHQDDRRARGHRRPAPRRRRVRAGDGRPPAVADPARPHRQPSAAPTARLRPRAAGPSSSTPVRHPGRGPIAARSAARESAPAAAAPSTRCLSRACTAAQLDRTAVRRGRRRAARRRRPQRRRRVVHSVRPPTRSTGAVGVPSTLVTA